MSTSTVKASTATLAEIYQQPQAWTELIAGLETARPCIDAFLARALADESTRIILTGAGTSAFVGLIAAESLRRGLGRRVDAVSTTDLVADPRSILAEDLPVLLVSFARSGNSPESLAATALIDQLAPTAHHLIITCDASGSLARGYREREDSLVLDMPQQTNDTGFAMTSSFTSMLLASLISLRPELASSIPAVVDAAEQVLAQQDTLEALLDESAERIVYLGSGALQGLARESALKTLELTAGRIAAFHDSPLGFRHGPKAIVDDTTTVIVFRSAEPYTAQYDDDLIAELRGDRPEQVLVIGAATDGPADIALPGLDDVDDAVRAAAFVIVAQLLAHASSVRHGRTPDNPFPDGTVNRVVQGVRIHPHRAAEHDA